MGWWSASIMGGDAPLDIQSQYEDTFTGGQGFCAPTPEDAISFIDVAIRSGEEAHLVKQVVGFILMQAGAAFSPELRRLVLDGIDSEDPKAEGWNKPEERAAVLADFRKRVEEYPDAGSKVEMPHQPGLMETIMGESPVSEVTEEPELSEGQILPLTSDNMAMIQRLSGLGFHTSMSKGSTFNGSSFSHVVIVLSSDPAFEAKTMQRQRVFNIAAVMTYDQMFEKLFPEMRRTYSSSAFRVIKLYGDSMRSAMQYDPVDESMKRNADIIISS